MSVQEFASSWLGGWTPSNLSTGDYTAKAPKSRKLLSDSPPPNSINWLNHNGKSYVTQVSDQKSVSRDFH